MAQFDISSESAHDPDSRYAPPGAALPNPDDREAQHELDGERGRALFLKLWTWWCEGRDAHFKSRAERLRDHEFYDNRQWTDEEIVQMEARGQAPLVFNIVGQMADWIIGTERRTRVDWNVLPRNEEDVDGAALKKNLLKYVSDVNQLGWERSQAFEDQVISGVGFIEDCVVSAANEEPITSRYQDWKGMWWDAHSRDNQFRDARWILRKKYLDCDYAKAMFRDRAALIDAAAQSNLDPGLELVDDDAMLSSLHMGQRSILAGSVALILGTARSRVCVYEMWFREPVTTRKLESVWPIDDDPLHGKDFDPNDKAHAQAVNSKLYTLTEGVTDKMKVAFFVEGGLLAVRDSPYRHGRFPFTAFWAYRDHLTGMPYGCIRKAIDPQRDYNKRKSKALHLLLVNRIQYEDGAIDETDEEHILTEASRPDGQVRLRKNALAENRFRIDEHADLQAGHVRLMEESKENIHEATGVTRDNVGQESNAISGRAILAKQQQGAVTTAKIFDNYRLGMQCSGQKALSNTEQFMSAPKKFRILGPDGAAKWEAVNQPMWDPLTETVRFENDITKHQADFIVDQQDFRETMRMALAETLFEMLGKLDAATALQLLDIAVDLLDIPNKSALANRIRSINGQPAPGTEDSPEVRAAKAARDEQEAQAAQLGLEKERAETRLLNSKADKTDSESTRTTVQGKREALGATVDLSSLVPLAPAADRLFDSSRGPSLSRPEPRVEAA